ncbi:MAG: Asp-tRNA(Asn)/Glu-tRNA(Gln) amidotransferase subunit GatC [Planctomycetes bacterium]|nr:Asp-tRNA(Asn)/Glu-tRNA(Gln) amidotransferase subunit GatC [Planctomycetota bacterium]
MTLEVDRSLLQTLADLTRLHIPAEQQDSLARRLGGVVEAFSALAAVPTAGVDASPYPLPLPTVLRADVPEAPLAPDIVTGNAARSAAGAFLVPRVIDG